MTACNFNLWSTCSYSVFHSLEWNVLTSEGATALTNTLKVNQSLKTLK